MQSATLRNSALWICQSLGWSSATESACYYIWFPNAPGASTLHDRGAKPQVGQWADLQVVLHIGHLKHFRSNQVCQTFQILLSRTFSKLWIKFFIPPAPYGELWEKTRAGKRCFFFPFLDGEGRMMMNRRALTSPHRAPPVLRGLVHLLRPAIFSQQKLQVFKRKKNNSKRPVDALVEKHPWPTYWQLEIKRC